MNPLDLACQTVIERHALGTSPGLSPLQNLLLNVDLNPTLDDDLFPSVPLARQLVRFGLSETAAEAWIADLRGTDPVSLTLSLWQEEPDTEALQALNPAQAVEYLIPLLVKVYRWGDDEVP